MKNKTTEELEKQLADLQKPGAWDYDPDVAYARAHHVTKIREELNRRKEEK